ncbi:hypothetical protein AABB24_013175 [Solanum stoloniferum]|uniref:Cytochrome P450 724B1 n=1 Tax=Solanum stoloniferum TaxID=62892 RepID=A0ABD2U9S1_9SOLN
MGEEGSLLIIVITLVISFVIGITLNHFWPLFFNNYGTTLHVIPKGTFGWPLLGETLSFLKPHPSNSIGTFLQQHCSRYGKVFKSHLFFSPTVVSCDQDLNYFILQNEDKLFQCCYPKPIHGILGKVSLLVAVGDTHKRLRNVSLSLISTIKSKPEFINDVETLALQILQSWKDKDQVRYWEEARKFSFNVIVKQVLGLTPDNPQSALILQDFLAFMRGLISLPLYIPGTPYARAVQARSRISSTIKAIIEERRRKHVVDGDSKKNDFLEILLCVDTLSEEEKVSFVLDSLLGGYETTSLLMAMVVFFIGQSQTALDQLKEEHDNIRSTKEKELLNWEDYQKMDFTQKVINEALRYGNVVKFVHRKALKDVKFKDYVIPAGWKVLPVFSAVHLDPSVHPNALHFNPWRWESDEQISKKLTPFGGGSRCCPGFELAKVEVAFFLHHLVQKYRWEVEEGEQPIAYPYVEFKNGLTIRLHQNST